MPNGTRTDPFSCITGLRDGDLVGKYFQCQETDCHATIQCDPRRAATDWYRDRAGVLYCYPCFQRRRRLAFRIWHSAKEMWELARFVWAAAHGAIG